MRDVICDSHRKSCSMYIVHIAPSRAAHPGFWVLPARRLSLKTLWCYYACIKSQGPQRYNHNPTETDKAARKVNRTTTHLNKILPRCNTRLSGLWLRTALPGTGQNAKRDLASNPCGHQRGEVHLQRMPGIRRKHHLRE